MSYVHSHAIEVWRGWGGRGAGVGHSVGAGLCDVDLKAGDPQGPAGHLSSRQRYIRQLASRKNNHKNYETFFSLITKGKNIK